MSMYSENQGLDEDGENTDTKEPAPPPGYEADPEESVFGGVPRHPRRRSGHVGQQFPLYVGSLPDDRHADWPK